MSKYDDYEEVDELSEGCIILRPKKDDWGRGNKYYFVYNDGSVDYFFDELDNLDNSIHNFYNAFPTERLAKKAASMQRVTNALIMAKLRIEPDYEPGSSAWKHFPTTGEYDYLYDTNSLCLGYSTEDKAEQARQLLREWGML